MTQTSCQRDINWQDSELRSVVAVFAQEPFNPSFGVYKFLLSGEEGMATGANFRCDLGFGGSGLEFIAASTSNLGLDIFWMDVLLHGITPLGLTSVQTRKMYL